MIRKLIFALAALIGGSGVALAQLPLPLPVPLPLINMQGTPEDQAACGPDAQRLCRQYIPDQMRVLSCFQANRARLAPACRAVLEKYGQ
jgi:hypothetical protein